MPINLGNWASSGLKVVGLADALGLGIDVKRL
jgi:hypothetical protein